MAKPQNLLLAALALLLLPCLAQTQVHTVAITVDDLPFASGLPRPLSPADAQQASLVNRKILQAFSHHRIPATGFVIEQHVEQLGKPASVKMLEQWVRPGFDLGNHLYSHPDVNSLSVEQVEQEIMRGQSTIAPLLASISRKPEFLRFPYNHTGETQAKRDAIAAFMSARGYRLAPCTIDNSDYEFNAAYVLALQRRDRETAAKIRSAYLAYSASEIDWYTALDKKVFGYEPPHIMLLHDSPLNADAIEAIISLFERRDYKFVTLSAALKDPAYAVPETYITKYGPMWGYRWAKELHIQVNGRDEPNPPAWIEQYMKTNRADDVKSQNRTDKRE